MSAETIAGSGIHILHLNLRMVQFYIRMLECKIDFLLGKVCALLISTIYDIENPLVSPRNLNRYRWVAQFDLDEIILPMTSKSVPEMLDKVAQ